jgi:hypothetical protein
VRDGKLVTDKGTRLHGVTIPVDIAPTFPLTPGLFDDLANVAGLNTVHVYLENWAHVTGEHAEQADALVELTSQAGMYLILALAGGVAGPGHGGTGTFDLDKLRSFWSFYAPRYADRTHVLYEIQNVPEDTCNALAAATIDMEREIYGSIRAAAPATHVILLSYGAIPSIAPFGSAVADLTNVDWATASVAFHTAETCVRLADVGSLAAGARAKQPGIALLATEIIGSEATDIAALESQSMGWMSKRWLVSDRDPMTFRQELTAGGTSWCPDLGQWPAPSVSCAP